MVFVSRTMPSKLLLRPAQFDTRGSLSTVTIWQVKILNTHMNGLLLEGVILGFLFRFTIQRSGEEKFSGFIGFELSNSSTGVYSLALF